MSEQRRADYIPDKWTIVKLEGQSIGDSPLYKVLGGWYGGYTDGDSWRLSSGIVEIDHCGEYYLIRNESGSVYQCNTGAEGVSSTSALMLDRWKKELKEQRDVRLKPVRISIVKIEEVEILYGIK